MDTKKYLAGKSKEGSAFFGPHKNKEGYIFRLLAPGAEKAYIRGDFNEKKEEMRKYPTGVFSISERTAKPGDKYRFILENEAGEKVIKLDPYAERIEGDGASVVDSSYKFKNKRVKGEDFVNIYEAHLGSLLKEGDGFKNISDISQDLVENLKKENFTYIKFLPVNEYTSYRSKGYSSVNLFSYSKRYGEKDDFKTLIDALHKEGIGVILEMDLSEFDPSEFGLASFDFTRAYDSDYDDIRYNYFGSINYDFSKNFVKSYILSAVNYRLEDFKLDGLAIPSINNLIFWQGDSKRGLNQTGVDFLEEVANLVHSKKALFIGNYYGYLADLQEDLPFDYIYDSSFKDIIKYFQTRPYFREEKKESIGIFINDYYKSYIFGFSYVDSISEFSSLFRKMWSENRKMDQYKALFTYLYTLNSKKMIFMGDEVALKKRWDPTKALEEADEEGRDFLTYYKALTDLCRKEKAFSHRDSTIQRLDIEGFSTFSYLRSYKGEKYLVILNLTDIDYEVISPYKMTEVLNSTDINLKRDLQKEEKIKLDNLSASIFKVLE